MNTVAPAPGPRAEAPAAPAAEWTGSTLRITGDWQGVRQPLPPPPAAAGSAVSIDARGLAGWDARLASSLWQVLSASRAKGITLELDGLPAGLQQILQLSLPEEGRRTPAPPRRPRWLTATGQEVQAWWRDAKLTLAFVGEVLIALGRLLRGRSDMRWADLAWQIDQTGPRSVPIVSLVSFMVGLILAYMGAAQLQRFGAKSFIADLMTVSEVREIAALLTGVILSGRVGAAFAAQIGSMRANDELDALRTLGIDPVGHLVLPRMLALLLVSPLLTVYAALVGLAVGWAAAVGLYGVASAEYIGKSIQALSFEHVAIGLFKGTVYGVLVALAGCRQGLAAGKSAQAVGDATTQAVVTSIVWIVTAASLLTVMFQRVGI